MKKYIEHMITIGGIAVLISIFAYQVVYGTSESSYKWGYKSGLKDGKGNVRDQIDACDNVFNNSTSDTNECIHAYDIGFKQGCDIEATHPSEPNPDDSTCQEYFTSLPLGIR